MILFTIGHRNRNISDFISFIISSMTLSILPRIYHIKIRKEIYKYSIFGMDV